MKYLALALLLTTAVPAFAKDDVIRFEPTVELQWAVGKDHWHCSGFYVGHGVIVTAGHCVNTGIDVTVTSTTGAKIGLASPMMFSKHEDVGILVIANEHIDALPLDCGTVHVGQDIEVRGWPDALGYVATWGKVNNLPREFEPDWSSAFIVSAQFDHGVSGGPVIDTVTHKAIGIVVGFAQPNDGGPIFNLAVPTSIACRLLDRSS